MAPVLGTEEADMKRQPALLTVTVAAGLALSSCGFGGSDGNGDSEGSTTLELLVPTYSDNTRTLWDEVIAGFEEEHDDIRVSLEVQSWDNINDVIRTKVQSNAAPDILNIDAFAGFASDDLLYAVPDVVSPETLADFQDSFADNASIGGTMYGLPLIASARTLFYNVDLFEEAGVDSPPSTWEELLDAAAAIDELGGDVYGYGMPLGSEEAQAETSIFTFGNGGSWADGDDITVVTPQNVEAVEFMKELIDAGVTQPDPGASDRTPMFDVFFAGQMGMVHGLPPTVGQIEERNPDLNYDTAPIPTKDGSPMTLGVADHLMAFENDGSKQEAITAFLDYFFSADVYTNFVDTEGFLPTTKSGADALAGKEEIAAFLDALPDAQFYPSTNEKWSATQGALQSLVGQIDQGKDAETVLEEVQNTVDAS
jgi:ABC-type glycerol-3-phosphate transport system substrate-binding protein